MIALKSSPEQLTARRFGFPTHLGCIREPMKDFSHAAFSPELISIMQQALEQAISTLPHPLRSTQVQSIAENILRGTKEGERNPTTLKTMALLEFQLRAGEK
jgi:hypothetical protein